MVAIIILVNVILYMYIVTNVLRFNSSRVDCTIFHTIILVCLIIACTIEEVDITH